jgi:hypothetical protein
VLFNDLAAAARTRHFAAPRKTRMEAVDMARDEVERNGCGEPLYMVPVHPDRVGLFEVPSSEYFYVVTRNGLCSCRVKTPQKCRSKIPQFA